MPIEQALSGLSQALFFMMAALLLVALALLLLECGTLVFIKFARVLLVKIRRDLASFSDAMDGKTPQKAIVSRIENGRKKFSKAVG